MRITGNRLLDGLPDVDRERLACRGTVMRTASRHLLFDAGEAIATVYFPVTAVASLITVTADGSEIEVTTIGSEGVVGLQALGDGIAGNARALSQVGGSMLAVDAATFRAETERSASLRTVLDRYGQALLALACQQVACNRLHGTGERLARWLLVMQDRLGTREIPMTQEFLAARLGVRRASVTEAAGRLRDAGAVRLARRRFTLVDREALEAAACECYAVARRQFAWLGPPD